MQTQQYPLYVVTHGELTAGYQIAQVAHAVADFALHKPEQFKTWHVNSQYIVALQVPDKDTLATLLMNAEESHETIAFYEPDLMDSLTSIAFVPHERNKRFLANLPLAGKTAGRVNKHNVKH